MIAILAVVISGIYPRYTAILHIWVTLTIAGSITLPDGGDAIALTITVLLLPMCVADDRRWHWAAPTGPLNITWRAIASMALLAIRVQIAFIYLDSAISKFAVDDWANGTAEYYILHDPGFGDAGLFSGLVQGASANPVISLALTWGAMIIEIAIGLAILLSWRWRILALALDIALHAVIIVTMGLFSFSFIMVGSAIIAANPAGAERDGALRSKDFEKPVRGRDLQLSP